MKSHMRYFSKLVDYSIFICFLTLAQLLPMAVRGVQNTSTATASPERPKRPIYPAPVRHGFIPEEWFQAFYPKTGASGR